MPDELPPDPSVTPEDAGVSATIGAAGEPMPSEAELARAEEKPPLYRFFRGGLYVAYMIVAVWFCLSVAVNAWRAVWGEPGRGLQAQETSQQPVRATPP